MEQIILSHFKEILEFARTLNPRLKNFQLRIEFGQSMSSNADAARVLIGLPGLSYSINQGYFNEYESFNDDPYIGSITVDDPNLIIKALLCHEIAHSINVITYNDRHHGDNWKFLYRILREKFVNNYIPRKGLPEDLVPSIYTEAFLKKASSAGLSKDVLGKTINDRGTEYKIVGWNPKARKNYILLRRTKDDRSFATSPEHIKSLL